MSFSKPLTLARVEDLTLGAFSNIAPSQTLDHLVRFLSTWSGSDKLFMIIQYTVKLIVPFLQWRARLQYGAGLRKAPVSPAADRLAILGNLIGDARMFFRIWGLLPIFQWLIALERNSPPTRWLRTIERLQGWSMLAYYPLEHLYYLLSHSVIPNKLPLPSLTAFIPFVRTKPSDNHIPLDLGKLGLWSTRFWAAYVVLQLAHLQEDSKLLTARERTLNKSKTGATAAEKEDIRKRRSALWNEFIVNLAYLPLTIHWSTEKGIISNDVWVSVLGLIAGVASWKSGWEATALTPAPTVGDIPLPAGESTETKLAPYLDDPLKDVITAPALDEL
ncbi:hypothetical protein BD309DRAFT_974640 [Dichomitus squalens]|uniref:Peroxisomal biogenesis factor 11 n=1 Tax=Dichomitus squalens TaxID=114155 RepID=A0A4Q9NA53_9APHY|nr:hypothetical protein BD311DRAFT_435168 [Dichomitus squalens]TBU37148.1 hypothetical protein BD309DRAFT_974640 [Dichomitus squalens]TBU62818.1 hypothetical protein BD310DRAFT_918248 [Dichomitus squalens]